MYNTKRGENMNIELLKIYDCLYTQEERKQLTASMIAEFRKANKLMKKEVAELIGIKPQTYGAYESGRNETPAEVLVRLSILYDVPVDMLIQRDKMSKEEKSAQEQLQYYDEQIKQLREEILKGNPEAREMLQMIVDSTQALTDAIKKASEKKD